MAGGTTWQDAKAEGNAAYAAGRTADAVGAYTAALQAPALPPSDRATILCNRAQCYLKLADYQRAVEDCTACLTLAPDNVKALFRRAAALEALDQLRDALRDYRDVARLSPGVADAAEGARRLERALGLAPAQVAPADGALLELSEDEMRSLSELAGRVKEVKRQRARAHAQLQAAARERRATQLTQATLEQLPPATRAYRGVGRMFLAVPRAELDGVLGDKAAKADARIRVCESTLAYVGGQEREAEEGYGELVAELRAKRGGGGGGGVGAEAGAAGVGAGAGGS